MLSRSRLPVAALAMGLALAATACGSKNKSSGSCATFGTPVKVSILPSVRTVEAGYGSLALSAKAVDAEGCAVYSNGTDVTWTTSDDTVATVDGGVLIGLKKGVVTITAEYLNISSDANSAEDGLVTVTAPIAGLQLFPAGAEVEVGSTLPLHLIALYGDKTAAEVTTDSSAAFSTDGTGFATVDVSDTTAVDGVAQGSTVVTGTYHGLNATRAVKVDPAPTAPTATGLSIDGDATRAAGTTGSLFATETFSDASTKDVSSSVTWTCPSCAVTAGGTTTTYLEIASDGTLTADKAGGPFTVTATYTPKGGTEQTATFDVTVVDGTLTTLVIAPATTGITTQIPIDATVQFTATGTFGSYVQDITNDVSWSIANASTADKAVHAIASGSVPGRVATTLHGTLALTPGDVVLVADFGSDEETLDLSIAGELSSIAVTAVDPVTLGAPTFAVGTPVQFVATATYDDGGTGLLASFNPTLTSKAAWFSSANGVLLVDNTSATKGLGTPIASGSSTVAAYYSTYVLNGADGSSTWTQWHGTLDVTIP